MSLYSSEPCVAFTHFSELKQWFPNCFLEYSEKNADTQSPATDSTVSLMNVSESKDEMGSEKMCKEALKFQDAKKLGTLPVVTAKNTYAGGGLVADLGYEFSTAQNVIYNLKEDKWVTRETRAIFLEMVFFEPATNIFAFVRFTFEFLTTGRIYVHQRVDPLSFYGSGSPTFDGLFIFCYFFIAVLVVVRLYREIKELRKRRCCYFKDPWNYLEFILSVATIATIVVFFFKAEFTRLVVQKIQRNPFARVSFDYVALWTDVESVLLAVVIFIATLKFLRIVKFNEHISILAWTMRFSRGPLVSYSVIFMIKITAFSLLGNLLFGSMDFMYSTFVRTVVNCFEMILGKGVDFAEMKGHNGIIGPLYLLMYNFCLTILVMNFFVAILCDSFTEAREKTKEENEDVEITDFTVDYLKSSLKEISDGLRDIARVKSTKKVSLESPSWKTKQRDYFLY